MTNNGALTVNNGASALLTGTLTNNGTVTLNGAGGNFGDLRFAGATTLAGTGTVNLVGVNARVFTNNGNGERLTIGAGQTVQGIGNLGIGRTTFTNSGNVFASVNGGTLTVQPGGSTADFTNNATGTIGASNGGTLAFSNANGGTLTNNGNFTVADGSTFTVPAGALTNLNGTTLTGGSYYLSASSATSPATLSLGGGSIVTSHAAISLYGPGTVFNEINTLATNASDGSLSLAGGRNFTTAGALTNAGSLGASGSTLTVSGSLNNSGLVVASGNGMVAVQGTLANSGVLAPGYPGSAGTITATGTLTQTATGSLVGAGTVTAPTLSLAGSLRPGDYANTSGGFGSYVGMLTLSGQVGLSGNTSLVFDLASTNASDKINVSGVLTLAGTLNVNAMAGFGAGRYDLIDYTGTLTNNGLTLEPVMNLG